MFVKMAAFAVHSVYIVYIPANIQKLAIIADRFIDIGNDHADLDDIVKNRLRHDCLLPLLIQREYRVLLYC